MAGYPNLHPSGFVEVLDKCDGPTLYKSQPSRESYAPTLNDFMSKYVTGEYTDLSLQKTAETLKRFSRQWVKLPKNVQGEFLRLILEGNGDLSKALKYEVYGSNSKENKLIQNLHNSRNAEEAADFVNNFLVQVQQQKNSKVLNDLKCAKSSSIKNLAILLIAVILSLVLGYTCSKF